jgi:hypothetical protein
VISAVRNQFWGFIVEIEKNIPLPAAATAKGQNTIPLGEMEVGDSVAVPAVRRGTLSTAIRRERFRSGKLFATRVVDAETIRVWRTA